MSVIVKAPLARARSPNPRTADQYIFLHVASQKRCGDPPRRARNGRSHHSHNFEDPSVITETVNARHSCFFITVILSGTYRFGGPGL
jgi:hypothetical protein